MRLHLSFSFEVATAGQVAHVEYDPDTLPFVLHAKRAIVGALSAQLRLPTNGDFAKVGNRTLVFTLANNYTSGSCACS